jgi:hypothetical protein
MARWTKSVVPLVTGLAIVSCSGFYGVDRSDGDGPGQDSGPDGDVDTDSDGDNDGDGDIDGDIDSDTDGDSDGDGDSDADSGGDSDSDTDSDLDSETEADATDVDIPEADAGPVDTDEDTISDDDEDAEDAVDTDADGVPDFLDTDSDGDGVLDRIEAGDNDRETPPIDTDRDGIPDFRDIDSDNDFLSDGYEELVSMTDRLRADTDGDGAKDLEEVMLGTGARDAADNPATRGILYFLSPHGGPPSPASVSLEMSTEIVYADFYFLMDISGSMADDVAAFRAGVTEILASAGDMVSEPWLGLGIFSDYPVTPYGGVSTSAYQNRTYVTDVEADFRAGLEDITNVAGGDSPTSAVPALHAVATGCGDDGVASRAIPDDPGWACGSFPLIIGYPHFRSEALPVVMLITDGSFHNGPEGAYAYNATTLHFDPPSYDDTVAALNGIHARVLGLDCGYGTDATVFYHLRSLASDTGTAGEDEGGVVRPLVYSVDLSMGRGELTERISEAIEDVTTRVPMDVAAFAVDPDPASPDAAVELVDRIVIGDGPGCVESLEEDVFTDVLPGATVCFDLFPRMNAIATPLAPPTLYRVSVAAWGDEVAWLDEQTVYFIATWSRPLEP